jgi:glycosyltransferase A (GT-A) superfamily protein (DUF2064 family)
MTRTILIVTGAQMEPAAWPGLYGADRELLQQSFCADLAELAQRLPASRVQITAAPAPEVIRAALAHGPLVLVTADVPHLPLWRLHDAFTRLADGADMVLGPTDDGSWYLIGLHSADAELIAALPQPGAPSAALIAAARLQQRHLVCLPPWYRIADLVALERLGDDLRTMPVDTAPRTRTLLLHPTQARAVGG